MVSDQDRPPFRADRVPEPQEIPRKTPDEQKNWIDQKKNVDRICFLLVAASLALLLIDPLIHKHGPFVIEHWWGFYGILGFAGCTAMALVARMLRTVLKRSEDYYDR